MELRCTCGAALPEDARFCHRCGRPQYAEDIERMEAPVAASPVPQPDPQPFADPLVISFKNSRAVLISLLMAAASMLACLPVAAIAAPLFPVFLCAIGFFAVRFYNARSSAPLSSSAGARLGWMTGLWLFIVVVVMVTVTVVFVSSPEGWSQLQANFAHTPQASQLTKLTQHDFLMQMLLFLPFSFVLLTMLPGLGGILGAKFWARRHSA